MTTKLFLKKNVNFAIMSNGKLNALTLNVRGLNDSLKRKKLYTWLEDNDIHIAFLQETFFTKMAEPNFKADWKGKMINCVTDSCHSRGVTILISHKIDCKIINLHVSEDGRKLLVNIEVR